MNFAGWIKRGLLLACVLAWAILSPIQAAAQEDAGQAADGEDSMYHEAYYVVDVLNEGLPEPREPLNRQTPQAALELLVLSVRNGEDDQARHALNLNLIPTEMQAARASELAPRLVTVITDQYLLNWDRLPDRPDGQDTSVASGQGQSNTGPQRSILLGTLDVEDRGIEIRVQRVKAGDADPVWVISPNTVENIDALYGSYGPSALSRMMPAWAHQTLWGETEVWELLALLILLLTAIGVGMAVRWVARKALQRADKEWVKQLVDALPLPLAVVAAITAFYLPLQSFISLTGPVLSLIQPAFYIALVSAVLWLVMRAISFIFQYFSEKYTANVSEDDGEKVAQRRQALTTLSVVRRVLVFALIVVGLGLALSQFRMFRSLGITMLASAGVFSVIVAIAAQPVLGSIVAGMQIAATEPIRIGDTVMFEGNWSEVEDITQTYVTLLTWDERRIIVPLQYLTNHTIENWSKTDSHMMNPIYLYLDYRTDVQAIRDKFEELVQNSDDYDGKEAPNVLVTDTSEETITVRCTASGATPSAAWSLRCSILEELLVFVRDLEGGRYLPRQRLLLQQNADYRNALHDNGHNGSGEDSVNGTSVEEDADAQKAG